MAVLADWTFLLQETTTLDQLAAVAELAVAPVVVSAAVVAVAVSAVVRDLPLLRLELVLTLLLSRAPRRLSIR